MSAFCDLSRASARSREQLLEDCSFARFGLGPRECSLQMVQPHIFRFVNRPFCGTSGTVGNVSDGHTADVSCISTAAQPQNRRPLSTPSAIEGALSQHYR